MNYFYNHFKVFDNVFVLYIYVLNLGRHGDSANKEIKIKR